MALQLIELHRKHGESLVDVVVKLSPDPGAFLLLRFNQLSTHVRKSLFHLLAAGNVLGEDENPSRQSLEVQPRTNLPADPCSAAFTIPTVFVGSRRFSRKSTAVNFFPTVGNIGKEFVVRAP